MNAPDTRYRRNFVIALTLHASVIAGLVAGERWLSDGSQTPANSEIIQADILGELPEGTGTGRGLYKAPEPPGPAPAAQAAPAAQDPAPNLPADEAAAPEPKATAPPKPAPDEISIPKKTPPKKAVAEAKPAATTTGKKAAGTATTNTAAAATATKTAKASAAGTGSGKGSSAEEIRNRFAKALGSSPNGTAYGDGKAAGGGTGKSGKIGSPNGLAEGEVGGIGQGTPNARYLQHVHDVLYEAWEQPGSALDKRLITTIHLRIARDGSIADASVKIGSGNKLMDDSVLAAVRKVPRLEPPPAILVHGEYAVIPVNFSVEG